ncbi:MAG: hypothetical protein DYG92_01730 [Leptolyngbya sp. PLA1]|nr:hypothetical protein [Leptolyngbya sp. PLA1]
MLLASKLRRSSRVVVSAAAALVLLAGRSSAEPPAVLDVVPTGQAMVVAVRNLGELDAKIAKMSEEMPALWKSAGTATVAQLRKFAGAKGVNAGGSGAMVVPATADGEGDEDRAVLILPIADFAGFVSSFGGQPGEGAVKLSGPDGEFFARDLGNGFGAFGKTEAPVVNAPLTKGAAASHVALMGAMAPLADSADLLVLANPAAAGKAAARRGAAAGAGGVEAGAADAAGEKTPDNKLQTAIEAQGQLGVLALTINERGICVDAGVQFKENSTAAILMNQTTDSASLMASLPSQAFYLAGAVDASSPGMRLILNQMGGEGAAEGGEGGGLAKFMSGMFGTLLKADGFSVSIGQSAGGVLGGTLFSNTIGFARYADPAAAMTSLRASRTGEGADATVAGTKVKVTYEADQPLKDMPEQKVDVWTTNFEFDEADEDQGQLAFAMGMIMGGTQVTNMAAPVEKGVYYTMSRNSRLVRSAVNVSKSGQGQETDPLLAKAREGLPEKRSFEFYLGVKPVMEAVRDTMMLEEADLPIPAGAPPIAAAGTTDGGAMVVRLFMHRDSMKAVDKTMEAVRAGMGGGGGGETQF